MSPLPGPPGPQLPAKGALTQRGCSLPGPRGWGRAQQVAGEGPQGEPLPSPERRSAGAAGGPGGRTEPRLCPKIPAASGCAAHSPGWSSRGSVTAQRPAPGPSWWQPEAVLGPGPPAGALTTDSRLLPRAENGPAGHSWASDCPPPLGTPTSDHVSVWPGGAPQGPQAPGSRRGSGWAGPRWAGPSYLLPRMSTRRGRWWSGPGGQGPEVSVCPGWGPRGRRGLGAGRAAGPPRGCWGTGRWGPAQCRPGSLGGWCSLKPEKHI